MSLPFLKKFKTELTKLENVSTDFRPPSHWYTCGNYAVNKILSGDFFRGIPQGRVTILAGPSDCITGDQTVEVYLMNKNVAPMIKEVID